MKRLLLAIGFAATLIGTAAMPALAAPGESTDHRTSCWSYYSNNNWTVYSNCNR